MHMLKDLAQHPEISKVPLSGIGGIETWRDVVEFILLGATSVQVCTAVMHYGFGIVREMEAGLRQFMEEKIIIQFMILRVRHCQMLRSGNI